MDLENIILSEVSQRQILYDIAYMWILKNNTNELTYKPLIDSQTQKTNYGYQRGRGGRDKLGIWDQQIHTTIYKIDNQQ